MEILAFLCLSVMAWVVGLAIVIPTSLRRRVVTYTLVSLAIVVGGLVVFELVSWLGGLVRFGQAQTLSIPQDYLSHGSLGVVLLLIALVAMVSPVIVAWIVRRRSHDSNPS